ncbi:hypothetical protein ACFLZ8_03995 [Planctomycetota bacterium]
MKKLIILLIANVLFFAGYVIGGPVEMSRISSEANWLACVDCEQFIKSDVSKIIRTELAKQGVEQKLSNFTKLFGFHPLDDVRNIMLYGQGHERENAVVLLEGKFDKAKLLALVGLNPEYKEIKYDNITIQQWLQKDSNSGQDSQAQIMYGCFYRDDMIILGSGLPAVKNSIDVLNGSAASASNRIFTDTLLKNENAFFQIATNSLEQIVGSDPKAVLLKQAEQLVIIVGEDENSVFSAVNLKAKSQESAGYINQMLEGFIVFLTLADEEQPALAKLAQMVKLSSVEDIIQIRLELQPELIQQIISSNIDDIEE